MEIASGYLSNGTKITFEKKENVCRLKLNGHTLYTTEDDLEPFVKADDTSTHSEYFSCTDISDYLHGVLATGPLVYLVRTLTHIRVLLLTNGVTICIGRVPILEVNPKIVSSISRLFNLQTYSVEIKAVANIDLVVEVEAATESLANQLAEHQLEDEDIQVEVKLLSDKYTLKTSICSIYLKGNT